MAGEAGASSKERREGKASKRFAVRFALQLVCSACLTGPNEVAAQPRLGNSAGTFSFLATLSVMRPLTPSPPEEERATEYGYTVIYEKLVEGGYQVFVPALPGIVTYGRTVEEAREMAQDAILCHIRALRQDGEEIPEDPFAQQPPLTEQLKVTV